MPLNTVDLIVIAVVLVIVALAAVYIYKAKKKGVKCIGCPDGCNCGKDGASCSGCNNQI